VLKKVITYKDFDGNAVTETHYFHLSKSELIEMELTAEGGSLAANLKNIGDSADAKLILNTFRNLIGESYGERDPANPKKFFKSAAKTEEFMTSLAFDELFTELMTSPTAAAEFVSGLIPSDIAEDPAVKKALDPPVEPVKNQGLAEIKKFADDQSGLANPRTKAGDLVAWAFRNPTAREQTIMSKAQLIEVMHRQGNGWKAPFPVEVSDFAN
jgi:hypothetical protein